MTGTALVPRKRQAAAATKAEHLRQAKRDLAEGEKLLRNGMASCRSAAEHIAAAIDQGATQREVAKAIGKSQPVGRRPLEVAQSWRPGQQRRPVRRCVQGTAEANCRSF